ncbi:hypothetical protein GCM10011611_32010 [Aliidongia dinghuensis]|uniref:DUF4440 domain-containing protein n=1 Tax=Aliidongia dinghuensis TaxID=1867774 RepID=A0A8J2YVX7_9PROT|nr:DUF4440 domain-containing protein [Aliidongia dinghuensis]GGF23516.1 hypothetical protein GCM10011611_32010 [Aliidongia dinghuensis]
MRAWFVLLILVCGLFHGSAARAADPSWTADEQAVAAADEAFFAAAEARHGQAWAEFADETATVQGGHGKAEIGQKLDKLYARPGFSLTWHPNYAKVVGDIGVTSGPYEMHRQNADGHDQRSTGRYVTVWQRQSDGQWRFVWDGGTEDR